jgi:hypothetical protein
MVLLEGKPGGSLVTREEFLKLLTDFHNRLVDTERTSDRHDDAIAEMQAKIAKFESFFMEELHNIEENLKNFRVFMNRADQMLDSMPDRTEMENIESRFSEVFEMIRKNALINMDFREETRKIHANFEYQLGVIHEDLEKLGVDDDPQYSSDGESQSDHEKEVNMPQEAADDDDFPPLGPLEP